MKKHKKKKDVNVDLNKKYVANSFADKLRLIERGIPSYQIEFKGGIKHIEAYL